MDDMNLHVMAIKVWGWFSTCMDRVFKSRKIWLVVFMVWASTTECATQTPDLKSTTSSVEATEQALSQDAQYLYQQAQSSLVQIRTLLNDRSSQISTGSGFFVSQNGLILTNYHVMSFVALEPEKYRAVYVSPDGTEGKLELLVVDVVHDLAIARAIGVRHHPALSFSTAKKPVEGERLYSLGNPLDIGFAVTKGNYNGFVQRSILPQYFVSAALNPGMSGGPTLDAKGQVIGVNVAKRSDGELVSFLVPIQFGRTLLAQAQKALPIKAPLYPQISNQLLAYQSDLSKKLMVAPVRTQLHGHYQIPMPQEHYARCWGHRLTDDPDSEWDVEQMQCNMESHIYTGKGDLGYINIRYEFYDGSKLGPFRFLYQYSRSFGNEFFGGDQETYTGPRCHERTVSQGGLELKTVVCFKANRKFKGLFDASVMLATLNESVRGVQSRMDIKGVSFDNGVKLIEHYLKGFAWIPSPKLK